jgi:putative transposase
MEGSRSGYYHFLKKNQLKAAGYNVGRFRARSLMKKAGLKVKRLKRFKKTTDSRHSLPVAPNRVNQQFTVEQPDRIWCGDITYLLHGLRCLRV